MKCGCHPLAALNDFDLQVPPVVHCVDKISKNSTFFSASERCGFPITRNSNNTLHIVKYDLYSPAHVAWSLHRNLGFPIDLIKLMLEERGVTVDEKQLDELATDNEKVCMDTALKIKN